MAAKTIKVQAANQDRRVVLHEWHDDHPGGEVFIHGNDTIHDVAQTPLVKQKIHEGLLREVTADKSVTKLTDIEGIGKATVKKLAEAGISTIAELAAVEEPETVAEAVGVSVEQITAWRQQAAK